MAKPFRAVITGSVTGSSHGTEGSAQLHEILDSSLGRGELGRLNWPQSIAASRQIFRGDSFQLVIDRPEAGLAAALFILAWHTARTEPPLLKARLALGVGRIDHLKPAAFPDMAWGEFQGDGEAFQFSGQLLDAIARSRHYLAIQTPWPEINAELALICRFLEYLCEQWTPPQASAILAMLRGERQEEAARFEGISQSAVAQRFGRAGGALVKASIMRYSNIIYSNISQ